MIKWKSYGPLLGGIALLTVAGTSPVNALSVVVPSCEDSAQVEFTDPKLDQSGVILAYRSVLLRGHGADSVFEYSDVFANCTNGRMIVVKNNGEKPFAEVALFDRAAEAPEAYTLRDIAGMMRHDGYNARVEMLRKSSCLCADGFATEPRN